MPSKCSGRETALKYNEKQRQVAHADPPSYRTRPSEELTENVMPESAIQATRSIREFGLCSDRRRGSPERPLSNPARLIIPAIFEVSGLLSLAAGALSDIPALRSG